MSRRRRQDNKGWIDEGPRAPNAAAVGWSLTAHQGQSSQSRARGRDMEAGEYRDYALREVEVVG